MKLADFKIGTHFYTVTGQQWLCTDIGTRTILAIELAPKLDTNWFKGHPYMVNEVIFDEEEIKNCFWDEKKYLKDKLMNHRTFIYPSFPANVVWKIMEERLQCNNYPHKALFRIDRIDSHGEVYHPYAARKDNNQWVILVYLPVIEEFKVVRETDFISFDRVNKGITRKRNRSK